MRSLALLFTLLSLTEGRKVTIGLISFNTGGRLADRTAGDGSGHCDPLWFTGQDQCDVAMSLCIELVGQASPNASTCNTGWKSLGQLPMNQDLLSFQLDSVYGDWANPSTITVPGEKFLGFVVKVKANDVDLNNVTQLIDAYAYQMTNSSDLLCTPTPLITQSVPLGNERTYRHSRQNAASCGGVSQCPTALTLAWAGAECNQCTRCNNGGISTVTCGCVCPHGFSGAACQNIMCQHGGTSNANGTSCNCSAPFTGQFCENLETARTCRDHYVAMQLEGAPFPVLEAASGVFTINPAGINISVFCDMTTSPGGWTVIQRRDPVDASSVGFNKTWIEYQNTFGNLPTTHYLGNEPIYALTNIPGMPMALRVAVRECNDSSSIAPSFTYHRFSIASNSTNYTLNVSNSNTTNSDGGAGDALNDPFQAPNSDNGQPFATYDRPEHGLPPFLGTCAGDSGGGWWYGTGCGSGNLNSKYHADCNAINGYGIKWRTLNSASLYSMNYTIMEIIPQSVLPTVS